MKTKVQRIMRLLLRKKTVRNEGIKARCGYCRLLAPTSTMKKSSVDRKYYCNESHMKKGLDGLKLLTRMELLAGIKSKKE